MPSYKDGAIAAMRNWHLCSNFLKNWENLFLFFVPNTLKMFELFLSRCFDYKVKPVPIVKHKPIPFPVVDNVVKPPHKEDAGFERNDMFKLCDMFDK